MKPIKVTLTEDISLSLDGVNRKLYKKGDVLLSNNHLESRILLNIAQTGKAEMYQEQSEVENKGEKVAPPKQAKKRVAKRRAKS